jgi:hypothetical protein
VAESYVAEAASSDFWTWVDRLGSIAGILALVKGGTSGPFRKASAAFHTFRLWLGMAAGTAYLVVIFRGAERWAPEWHSSILKWKWGTITTRAVDGICRWDERSAPQHEPLSERRERQSAHLRWLVGMPRLFLVERIEERRPPAGVNRDEFPCVFDPEMKESKELNKFVHRGDTLAWYLMQQRAEI